MTVNSIARNQMSPAMMRLASGERINSAADDAAGLAIVENMTAQVRGLDQGIRNTSDMQALAQTAEGGLSTITDSAQRINELSVQALNGILTDDQRDMINAEISQLAQGIAAAAEGTQFNTINLLDGSVQNANTAAGPDGTGPQVSISDMSSVAQAMTAIAEDGTYDLSVISEQIGSVLTERASLGAVVNTLDYTANANSISSLNLVDARSRINDADMAEEAMNLEQDRVINEVQILMQQLAMQNEEEESQRIMTTAVS